MLNSRASRSNTGTIATLLVALHPLRVEATSWASGQSYLLASMFCLLSLLSYMSQNTISCHILLFCSVLCKAPAISFPIVFVAYDVAFQPKISPMKLVRKHLFTAIQTLLMFFFLVYGPSKTQGMKTREMEPIEYLTRALHCPSRYLFQSFHLPMLSPMYSVPDYNITPFSLEFLPSVSFTVAASLVSVCVLYTHKQTLYYRASVAWLCYLGLLSPTLGLVGSHVWGAFLSFPSLLHK